MAKYNVRRELSCAALAMAALTGGCGPNRPSEGYKSLPPPPHVSPAPAALNVPLDPQLREQARQILLHDADSDNVSLCCQAIEALQDEAPDLAPDPVLRELSHPDERVRFAAAVAAGQLHLDQAHSRLLRMRVIDPSRMVQVAVRFALHRLGDTRFSHDLEKFCADPSPEIRGRTALILGLLDEPHAAILLQALLNDAQQAVRLQAAESIWRLHEPGSRLTDQALDLLVAYAVSHYGDDLILATLALAAPHDESVIQHVRANLTTDYPEVNLAAARAMGMLGSDEGYNVAIKFVSSVDPRRRGLAALAFGAIGRPDTQTILQALLSDEDPAVALEAATAILQLHPAAPPSNMP